MNAPDRLWVCHRCKMIGDGMEAGRHCDSTGHQVIELSDEMTAAVREEKAKSNPLPSAADYIAFAEFMGTVGRGSR